jgi:ATP-dependent Clp protease ATP-binding subunit ClpC
MPQNFSTFVAAVMEQATNEARKRNHEYLGSEHIFLALLNTAGSVAQELLQQFAITRESVVDAIDRITQRGDCAVPSGCTFPKSPRAKTVVEIASTESTECGSVEIDQYHLMIGLLHETRELLSLPDHSERMCNTPTVVTQSLKNAGLDLEVARAYVRKHTPPQNNAG